MPRVCSVPGEVRGEGERKGVQGEKGERMGRLEGEVGKEEMWE